MVKPGQSDRSSAIDSGNGKLELTNDRAIIQVERVLSTQGGNVEPKLLSEIRDWCEDQKRMNKEANGGYSIAWKRLGKLVATRDLTLRTQLLLNCDDFRTFIEGVESGDIVPTPTPPASAVIVRQQGGVRRGLAGIYGRTPTPKPPRADESGAIQSAQAQGSDKVKTGNGNE